MLVKLGGCKKFDEQQYKACECIGKDKVTKSREAAIRYFYKKQAPENSEKAPQLATKAETPSQMAGLFLKLLRKYPSAIEKVEYEDPMADMLKKIKEEEGSSKGDTEDDADSPTDDDEEKLEL